MIKASLANSAMFGAAAVGVAAVGFIAFRAAAGLEPASAPQPPTPAITAAPQPAPLTIAKTQAPPAEPAKATPPEFDVVRVEPSGETVVAGRAAPQAMVSLFNGETKLGEAKADSNGQFVIIPKALPPGDHLLGLRANSPRGDSVSDQTVTVAVAGKPGEKTVAALAEPGKPTLVLGEPPKAALSSPAAPAVAIRTVEAGDDGAFYATGTAAPNASVRLYLNGSAVAGVTAAAEGKWAVKIERGMAPGQYDVRADAVDPLTGKVAARAQVPFDYPAPLPAPRPAAAQAPALVSAPAVQTGAAPAPQRASPSLNAPPVPARAPAPAQVAAATPPAAPPLQTAAASAPGLAVVPEIQSVTVLRGDNLWRISRKILGRGARYTQIYEANAAQIRDPNLIWPGQVFVAPRTGLP